MGSMSIWHWVIVALIVMLLFGKGRISEMMGDLAKGINSFKKGLADEENKRQAAEEERAASEAEKAEIAHHDAVAISALNEGLDRMASGDLTHRITTPFAPKTESLKTNFNAAA